MQAAELIGRESLFAFKREDIVLFCVVCQILFGALHLRLKFASGSSEPVRCGGEFFSLVLKRSFYEAPRDGVDDYRSDLRIGVGEGHFESTGVFDLFSLQSSGYRPDKRREPFALFLGSRRAVAKRAFYVDYCRTAVRVFGQSSPMSDCFQCLEHRGTIRLLEFWVFFQV